MRFVFGMEAADVCGKVVDALVFFVTDCAPVSLLCIEQDNHFLAFGKCLLCKIQLRSRTFILTGKSLHYCSCAGNHALLRNLLIVERVLFRGQR